MAANPNRLSQFWNELKRRRVVRVIIFYATASFVILELVSIITEPFGLPEWTLKLVFVILVIGFIISIVLSWIFDVTPDGIVKTGPMKRRKKKKRAQLLSEPATRYKGSIAVLPFQDMSPQKDQEYFCDGISEEIINALTRIENLKVIARTSAFAFKGKDIDIREIGKILNVENVLEGSIRKDGIQLRITAQLIKVEDGSHLWSEAYNRELKDIFTIQDEISLSIVGNLNLKLIGEEKGKLLKRPTEDTEAFQHYLKGLYCWQQMTPEGNQLAQENYTKAFTQDPQFALAYAILGSNYMFAASIGLLPPAVAWQKSKEHTHKALEIDNTIQVAHSSLAIIRFGYNWDWDGAEREFKLALEISPNSGWDHYMYSFYLRMTNRLDEAIAESISALDYDPYNIYISSQVGVTYLMAGLVDQAIEKQEWTIGIYPNSFMAHLNLGDALQAKSLPEKAIQSYEKAVQLSGQNPMTITGLACAYLAVGKEGEAKKLIQDLKLRMEKEYVQASIFIPYYIFINDLDQAYHWMELACREKELNLPMYIASLLAQNLLPAEARFRALVEQTGLDKYWK